MSGMVSETEMSPEVRRRVMARARRRARRAEEMAEVGRLDEAIACQEEVTELRPGDAAALLRLGLFRREARRFDAALDALRRAAALRPRDRDAREALTETLVGVGRYAEAIAEAKALVRITPRSLFARDVLSVAYLQTGRLEKAQQMVGEMVTLDPLNPEHRLKRAMLFQQQGNLQAAVGEYMRALEMSEPDTDAHAEAADALEGLDDFQTRQILLLASEDRVFHLKLRQDAVDAATGRGFHLSGRGVMRLRHLVDAHLAEMMPDPWSGGILRTALYN